MMLLDIISALAPKINTFTEPANQLRLWMAPHIEMTYLLASLDMA